MIKILIVDDERVVCEMIGNFFRQRGYSIFTESDPLHVMETVDKEKPQIIILDVAMPSKSGIDILREIRDKYTNDEIKVIMITVIEEPDVRKQALSQGADTYIEKPLNTEYLEEVVMKKILELLGGVSSDPKKELPKILIVEDEKEVVMQITRILNGCLKVKIYTAYDGQEAVTKMLENEFDLVVLDLKLPVYSGIEVLKKVRKIKKLPEVLVVSAYDSVEIIREALAAGAVEYLPKPLDVATLQLKVKVMLERKGKYIPSGD